MACDTCTITSKTGGRGGGGHIPAASQKNEGDEKGLHSRGKKESTHCCSQLSPRFTATCRLVAGDTCRIASSIAIDSHTIVCAPIKIGLQGTLGASSVLLPGVTVGSQATLAPLAVPALGSDVEAKTIYIGAPAVPGKVRRLPAQPPTRRAPAQESPCGPGWPQSHLRAAVPRSLQGQCDVCTVKAWSSSVLCVTILCGQIRVGREVASPKSFLQLRIWDPPPTPSHVTHVNPHPWIPPHTHNPP